MFAQNLMESFPMRFPPGGRMGWDGVEICKKDPRRPRDHTINLPEKMYETVLKRNLKQNIEKYTCWR